MNKIGKITNKTPESKRDNSVSIIRKTDSSHSLSSPIDQILVLQRTIGNQAVQRLFKSGMIKAKLRIGQPGDIYEQEADRVAEQVMRMPEPRLQRQVEPEEEEEETLQPKPLANQITPLVQVQRQEEPEEEEEELQAKPLAEKITTLVQRQVEPEEEEEEEAIQTKLADGMQVQRQEEPEEEEEEEAIQTKQVSTRAPAVTPNLASRIQSLKGGGQPLPKSVRGFFEPRFGYDFSHVRVHTDAKAAESARGLNAKAFTIGRDVVFRDGQYVPDKLEGRKLLAHELTHVVQQNKMNIKILPSTNKDNQEHLPTLREKINAQIQKHNSAKVQEGKRYTTKSAQIFSQDLSARSRPFVGIMGTSAIRPQYDRHIALLSDSRLFYHANAIQRARIVSQLQRTYGNTYVQRVMAAVQTKLKVGQPEEVHEQEANETAQAVMRQEQQIQQRPLENKDVQDNFNDTIDDEGHDFSKVRLHTGPKPEQLARSLRAKAFTLGGDIVFGSGHYGPKTQRGRKLMARELAHVIQQDASSYSRKPSEHEMIRDKGKDLTKSSKSSAIGGHGKVSAKVSSPLKLHMCASNAIIQLQQRARQQTASPNTRTARQRFPAMYWQFLLTPPEVQAMQAFMQGWTLPNPCPFANNNLLNRKQKALLAGAMLAAAGQTGAHCGDWVMRVYQYSQGDPYISSSDWERRWRRQGVPRVLSEPEYRWRSLAWSRTAVRPGRLTLIRPGCWVMYSTGRSRGHSILVTRVFRRIIRSRTGTIELEAMESGWFSNVNIPPRYRRMTLNCGRLSNGRRIRIFGSIYSIQKPHRRREYERWLRQRHRRRRGP